MKEDSLEKLKNIILETFSDFPIEKEKQKEYLNKKINEKFLNEINNILNFRAENQKKGMIKKASQGKLMSRAPFGYKIVDGKLIPAENFKEVEEIFEEFLTSDTSLRQLAAKHHLSVNGLKKILKNFTYIGKIKFNNEIHEGRHQPIISSILFNHVQNKLERLGIK